MTRVLRNSEIEEELSNNNGNCVQVIDNLVSKTKLDEELIEKRVSKYVKFKEDLAKGNKLKKE